MPRRLRLEYEGAIYHLMSRGDRKEEIFLDEGDREMFLQTLSATCGRTDWRLYAFCLMGNHFHLVVETPKANLCAGMHWLLGTYTARFNRRHGINGHLFSGRYKSLSVDGSGNGYLKSVCDYVHLNPVRANLLAPDEPLHTYRWSSYAEYLKPPLRRVNWLRVEALFGEWGIARDTASGRRRFARGMEERRMHERALKGEDWECIRRGWCWGGEAFREELLTLVAETQREHHHGQELRESEAQKAERLLETWLKQSSLSEAELEARRKGDPAKVGLAGKLRRETTMSWKWIAERLHMGHWRSAANAVRLARARSCALIHP